MNRGFVEMDYPSTSLRKLSIMKSEWLRRVMVQTSTEKVLGCDECRYTFRKIALLIITGEAKAKEFIARDGHDNYSSETVYNYERDLNVFSQFLDESAVKLTKVDRKHPQVAELDGLVRLN
jgi:hypothetical protein